MRNKMIFNPKNNLSIIEQQKDFTGTRLGLLKTERSMPEILFITSYPPRECGIATYSLDLIKALNTKFSRSFDIKICPLENENEKHHYQDDIKHILNTDSKDSYLKLKTEINSNSMIQMVLIQHEFGLFQKNQEYLINFMSSLNKPIITVFHTVLPGPDNLFRIKVQEITTLSENVIVMSNSAAQLLSSDYGIASDKIVIIAHGTHLVTHSDKEILKSKYNLSGRKVLSTFGLLSSGKSIETTLEALPAIIRKNPDVLFLIIGITHPSVVKKEGEKYRMLLESKVKELHIEKQVRFINSFIPLEELLEYLQLTDVYLFTSKDPNQAVSGTFSYAISCGCPIVCTPIPPASEILRNNAGIGIDFGNSKQVAKAVISLLNDDVLRKNISSNGLHQMASTAWENAAIAHALLFEKIAKKPIPLTYKIPPINLNHLKKLSTRFGIIQFSKINQPDLDSGYTLDDNARALIAMAQHYEITKEEEDLRSINTYFNFIKFCLQSEGYFLNYVDEGKAFTKQNNSTNLADANGRAIWALGYLISLRDLFPEKIIIEAEQIIKKVLFNVNKIHSTRAMAFIIKGLYYKNKGKESSQDQFLIKELANRMVQMYRHEKDDNWHWFESYLTYANSILSESLLCAWLATGESVYKEIAKSTFDFLLSLTFKENSIKVISNKTWLLKKTNSMSEIAEQISIGGEQPIDVAYTILALSKFQDVFPEEDYGLKMRLAFNWFLGDNHLNQIIYNPCTGGCYDGLEENNVNLNQGAESTISYLMARLTIEKRIKKREHLFKLELKNEAELA